VSPHTFFTCSVSPLFFVNLSNNFFPSGVTPWRVCPRVTPLGPHCKGTRTFSTLSSDSCSLDCTTLQRRVFHRRKVAVLSDGRLPPRLDQDARNFDHRRRHCCCCCCCHGGISSHHQRSTAVRRLDHAPRQPRPVSLLSRPQHRFLQHQFLRPVRKDYAIRQHTIGVARILSGVHFFGQKSWRSFLFVALKDHLNIPLNLSHPAKTVLKFLL